MASNTPIPLETLPNPSSSLPQGQTLNLRSTLQGLEQEIGPDTIDRSIIYPPTHESHKKVNAIKTSKYTIFTFLPLNLFGQFKRFYNLYFLLAALSTLAGNSSLSPVTSVLPLVVVLAVTACKDAYEDYKRHQADNKANNVPVAILENGLEKTISTMQVAPGSICKIYKGQTFPADLVVVKSSSLDGVCYIETSDLDGETNLKRRTAPLTTQLQETVQGQLDLSNPSRNLYEFEARITGNGKKSAPLSVNQFLPRGATLRNTDWVLGVAAYTGQETKVMLNLKNTGLKQSTLEARLNALILGMFIFNIVVLAVAVIMSVNVYTHLADYLTDYWYLYDPNDPNDPFKPGASINYALLTWDEVLTWFAIYSYLIPISLFVSLELARLAQIAWISHDHSMAGYRKPPEAPQTTALGRDAWTQLTMRRKKQDQLASPKVELLSPSDAPPQAVRIGWEPLSPDHPPIDPVPENWIKVPAQVNNSNLNEDLGVVDYIFSDKTGTLTKNEMVLARWWIPGMEFIEDQDPGRLGKVIARQSDNVLSPKAEMFAKALLCCHDVLPTLSDDPSQGLVYESQSPDDIAIVSGLRKDGMQLIGRSGDAIVIDWFGEQIQFEPLATLPFNSDRKRMSVVARINNVIYLFIKGADNKILERLIPNQPEVPEANEIIQRFAEVGLRTLLVAYRTLTEEDWLQWKELYDETEKQLKDRESKLNRIMEVVETDLTLLGATGVEDKLQDDVAATIAYLLDCDIKLWVLTGDKVETAINIGLSASVLDQKQNLIIIRESDPAKIDKAFDDNIALMKQKNQWGNDHVRQEDFIASNHPLSWDYVKSGGWIRQFGRWLNWLLPLNSSPRSGWGDAPEIEESWKNNAMIVTGDVLNALFDCWGNDSCGCMTQLQIKFLELGTRCKSVICCRVSPLQKAQIVRLVRQYLHKVTLAIGDGANDVSMIQAANVGVGISGKEGAQAVRAADYSFMEFRALRPLVAVHGRWNFLRMTQIIYYSFYKNIAMIMVQFIFAFYSLQSGTMVYNDSFLLFYNVFFTAVPPLVMSFFERDVARTPLYRYPELYRESRVRFWNLRTWIAWLLASLYVAVVVYYIPYLGFGTSEDILDPSGRNIGYDTMVFYYSAYILIVVSVKLAMTFKGWTHVHWASLVLSFLIFIFLEAFYMRSGQPTLSFSEFNGTPSFWFLGLLTLGVSLLPDWIVWSTQKLYYPFDSDIVNEEWAEICKRNRYYVPEDVESFPAWSDTLTTMDTNQHVPTLSVIPPEPIVSR